MAEFIVNPRRAARAPIRCGATVVLGHGRFDTDTEDIGALGCQIVAPSRVTKGDPVHLLISSPKVGGPLEIRGRVAWVAEQPPWRAGIAFDEAGHEDAALWVDRLVAAYPDLAGYRRVPQRLAVEQTVYLGPPPRFLVDFTADEAMLLRAIASGARIDELRARLRDRWEAAQRALFSLMARQAVTLQRGQSVHPDSWKKILTDLEASLAIDSLGAAGIAAPIEQPRAAPAEAKAPPRPAASGPLAGADRAAEIELESDDGAPLELAEPFAAPPEEAPAPTAAASPNIDRTGAGVGWRRKPKRSSDAQVAFDRGLAEIAAGNVTGGITFLRIALTLSPGDPEIAHHLGKVAFKPR